uniref:Uncharacterized protein n=1 Tax=Anguilla anguilla TaxID=7936 RepID=A0A0E9Q3W3_ANGAN
MDHDVHTVDRILSAHTLIEPQSISAHIHQHNAGHGGASTK